ncbi:MAG: DUF1501 domain-containing protein [Planctomycetia bacterium]|nr:DUF1501 domain-containing protein [Planctomycetia bacterium]
MRYLQHAAFSRRIAVQAGAVGLLGLGMNHLDPLQALAKPGVDSEAANRLAPNGKARSVIYLFLSGGLSQIDSFDMKPDAPDQVRGEFKPIATSTPGVHICEHMPKLAARSDKWAVVRSMAHKEPEHSAGHMLMLSGRNMLPPGFSPNKPMPRDWPSIAAIANAVAPPLNNLPPAVVLPETLIHNTGRVIPGQFAGEMGSHRNPMFLEMCRFDSTAYGAYPTHAFHHATGKVTLDKFKFQAPNLSLPAEMSPDAFTSRLGLLNGLERQRRELDQYASEGPFDRHRQRAISLLTDPSTQRAFEVAHVDGKTQDRYGRNSFGWSCLIARQLVESGVRLVQVNLGNDETWDTHGNQFPNLKNYLFPPTDQAVSALLDDLDERGLLESTMIVMAGEMGRTPRISGIGKTYKEPGRDHWGTQSVFFAGGGVKGGQMIGTTDKIGAYPALQPETPESMGATIYHGLGLPRETSWQDPSGRPHFVYHGDPIRGLI